LFLIRKTLTGSLGLILVFVFAFANCGSTTNSAFVRSESYAQQNPGPEPADHSAGKKLRQIAVPFDVFVLVHVNQDVWAIGRDSLAVLDSSLNVKQTISLNVADRYWLDSVTPNLETQHLKRQSLDGVLFEPAVGRLTKGGVFVYAVGGDASEQIWLLSTQPGSIGQLTCIDVVSRPNVKDGPLLGFADAAANDSAIFLPAKLRSGLGMLLSIDVPARTFKVVWKEDLSFIKSVQFAGDVGVMKMLGGDLLTSGNGGTSWQKRTSLPEKFAESEPVFLNSNEAYILKDGAVYVSHDGGETFVLFDQIAGPVRDLQRPEAGIVIQNERELFYKCNSCTEWRSFGDVNLDPHANYYVFDQRLLATSLGKLYVLDE